MELMLERLSETVALAESLEQLVRPLLEMLEIVTGLESVDLTSIDEEAGIQFVDYARNTGELKIDEGLAGAVVRHALQALHRGRAALHVQRERHLGRLAGR